MDNGAAINMETHTYPGQKMQLDLSSLRFLPWVYLAGITAAEILVALVSIGAGMSLHIIILLAVLVQAVYAWYRWEVGKTGIVTNKTGEIQEDPGDGEAAANNGVTGNRLETEFFSYRFYLGLTLGPLIRILSLAIPLASFPLEYWYLIDGIPLFAATFTVIKLADFKAADIFLRLGRCRFLWQNLSFQLIIGLVGIPLGFIEFCILRPAPLAPELELRLIILPALILVIFTGFAEELIFRGVIQRSADNYLGKTLSLIYVSILFAVLHITHLSALDVLFVFGVAVLFTLLVRRTDSLLGVTIAHGLTNINLFIIAPLLLK